MCVADGALEVAQMMDGGCQECQNFERCRADAIASHSFSTSRTGRNCPGYLNSATGAVGLQADLFQTE